MARLLRNSSYLREFRPDAPTDAPLGFHRRLPGYKPTPLLSLPGLARRLGIGSLQVKDECGRLGLPAYKILGAAWAAYLELSQRLGSAPAPWSTLEELRTRIAALGPLRLLTATDGNHGRGVARIANWLGLGAQVWVPEGTAQARIDAIASDGATVTVVAGTYDDTVAMAADSVGARDILIQDHGWSGYEVIPAWVAQGYETIFAEADDQMAQRGQLRPSLVLVQIGVGTLASAVVSHFRSRARPDPAMILGVEPSGADCALRSVEAGERVMLQVGAHASIMAGLNCGTPSLTAWPALLHGIAGYLAVEDDQAREAMRTYAGEGIVSGESGAAGLAGLMELMSPEHAQVRSELGITSAARVLLISTEGATDPEGYRGVVG